MSVRIVQVTDTHLYRDTAGVFAGISTWETFRAVLGQIERQHGDFDYLILTGDLAQDEELARLEEFLAEALSGRGRVVFVNGEAGSGKTALVSEFVRRAQEINAELVVAGGGAWFPEHGG